jgi:two-component system response regulator HydG
MQVKLLRVIQEREFQRVGGDETLSVDVRILAATNRDLETDVKNGTFREDLFYRLNVVTVEMPPLRDRLDDIPLLAQHFMKRFAPRNRKTVKGFTPQAMDLLIKYAWPGNVRELENAVERSVILLAGDYITERELPLSITPAETKEPSPLAASETGAGRSTGSQSLESIEKDAILATLSETGGNKSETARRLGINRKTLHLKLKRYGLA